MSKLEELIEELCPDGVEYKKLKECTEMKRGTSATKSTLSEGKIPVISGGREPAFYCDTYNRDGETITVAGSGAGAGYVQYWNIPIFVNDAFSIKGNEGVDTKYIYHYLLNIQEQIYATKKGGGVPHVHVSSIENFTIPIPPFPVQEEIVRILDNFTDLTAELQAELQARAKQYKYYLNTFFENQKENWIPLEQIGTLTRGKRFVHADATDKGVPCVHYGELYTYYGVHAEKVKSHIREELRPKMRYAHKGDVIIVGAGENNWDIGVGVAWDGDEDVAVHDACYTLCHNQNSKYISYFLRSDNYHNQIKKWVSEGKICSISAASLGKALIPIPSIEEQNRIVSILEQFDELCSSISKGLPGEIEARQKQYEYYRNKILSFESGAEA